ncbi:MAG: hypothetical protein J1F32_01765 [Erysipelotrichales bacterium]|nr:hypothetical protein [Erysipelotrichales bacterium]
MSKKVEIGDLVQFKKFKNGILCGVEKDIFQVVDVDNKEWESCNLLLQNTKDYSMIYTNRSAVLLAQNVVVQLKLF